MNLHIGELVTVAMINPPSRAYSGYCTVMDLSTNYIKVKTPGDVRITISAESNFYETVSFSHGEPRLVTITQEGENPNGALFKDEHQAYLYQIFNGLLLIGKKTA